ncbi:neuropeptide-like 1 isoform X2 [Teleopsis dalmanni]|uniref:neuropeptide-like 1 isoform X2 n=1 Tax=Teleopsis dalmanni TaxID=139649 RepID=UPI0018CD45D4|nr:neuropeptide-like 1 isoform X2 [Teleopsis dalmanni]
MQAGQPMTNASGKAASAVFKLWVILYMLLSAVQYPQTVEATDDVANISPYELESIINQLLNPSPEYQLHTSALRNQLNNILRERQLPYGEEQVLSDYDYTDEDKRSVASLAAQGLLHGNKRSLATLAKNGQLPTPEPEEELETAATRNEDKRYVGALARSGGFMGYGKRNIGTLARDFQLPQNGKRNLATMARLGLLTPNHDPKRNVASVARFNSNRLGAAEKRNLGALKGSPVHGSQQKREDEELMLPAAAPSNDMDYAEPMQSYWWYPNYAGYADLDWGDFARAQKRFLGRVLPPTRATASTHRGRL